MNPADGEGARARKLALRPVFSLLTTSLPVLAGRPAQECVKSRYYSEAGEHCAYI
jgi:hypothetical protein